MTTSPPVDMASDKPSRAHEGRKSSKPLMEKRRRARINDCLTELQTILDALNPEGGGSRQNKREKADILEQTVKLVKQLRQQSCRGNQDPHSQIQFRAGFNECISEVSEFLTNSRNSLNGDVRAGLLSHLADSLQGNKPFSDRFPASRRRVAIATNSGTVSCKPEVTPQTSNQSEAGNSVRNIVQPMPAVVTPSGPVQPVVGVPASVASNTPSVVPGLTARLELAPNGGNANNATRLVPIGIPIKVQSAGQFILLPSQMFNGGQLSAPVIPVLSPPTTGLTPSPASSTGSSGSVVVSPVRDRQSQSLSQPLGAAASQPERGTIMYASSSTALGTPSGSSTTITSAVPYPVAFVAMGDSSDRQNGGQYEHIVYPSGLENIPKIYLPVPGNPPSDTDPVWRPW